MAMLKVSIAPDDQRFAVRPPPRPRVRRPRASEPTPEPDIIEWGGQLMYVIGWTSGGFPYGLNEGEIREIFDQEEMEALMQE
jgi:hypothetical protein